MIQEERSIPRSLRERAEALIDSLAADTQAPDPDQIRSLIHELRVHQIELEIQNEELRGTQGQLEIARDGYVRLFHQAPVGYLTLDQNGIILQSNRTFAAMIGAEEPQLAGTPFSGLLIANDRQVFLGRFNAFFRQPEGKDLEVMLYRAKHEPLCVRLTGRSEPRPPIPLSGIQPGPLLLLIVSDITVQKRSMDTVKGLLQEKELILKEVHHRIKNNMQTIASLLSLQAASLNAPAAVAALQDARSRVGCMMMIYDKLYRSTGHGTIDVGSYLPNLVSDICSTFHNGRSVDLDLQIEPFSLDSRILVDVGMIINELITNVFKYAFPDGGAGRLTVRMTQLPNGVAKQPGKGTVELIIRDDGVGIPESAAGTDSRGFGLRLVSALVSHLEGELSIGREDGTEFRIRFPLSPS